jgi:osmotically inducible lipoprotein OsmB
MRSLAKSFLFAPALALAVACNKDKPADPTLNQDLGLAAQANQNRLDSVTAAERLNGTAAAPAAATPVAAAPKPAATTTHSAASSTTHRSTGSSGTRSASSGASAPAPREEVHKNTKRDAAIGAGAGAILGAATSGNKVKGALIGGAAGAILGGVIGNNVDVQKKKVPYAARGSSSRFDTRGTPAPPACLSSFRADAHARVHLSLTVPRRRDNIRGCTARAPRADITQGKAY